MKIKLHLHPAGVLLLILGLLVWPVAFLGLVFSTKFCMDNSQSQGYCGQLFQLEWYSVFFQLILLLAMLITCCMDRFEKGRYIYLSYLSIVTFLLSVMARNFISNSFKVGHIDLQDLHSDAYNAAAAGAILLCVVNYLLIVFLGLGATESLPEMEALKLKNLAKNTMQIPKYFGKGFSRAGFGAAQQKYQPSSAEGF